MGQSNEACIVIITALSGGELYVRLLEQYEDPTGWLALKTLCKFTVAEIAKLFGEMRSSVHWRRYPRLT